MKYLVTQLEVQKKEVGEGDEAAQCLGGAPAAALDAGVKSWVPTMIMENYGVSASFATVLTTILVVVNFYLMVIIL